MANKTKTRVWTITCPQCRLEMYSRAPHDFRECGCAARMMVDGGFAGYIRYGVEPSYFSKVKDSFRYRFINATKQQMYDDWSKHTDKFGLVVKKGAK
jgi:hypothetical protein